MEMIVSTHHFTGFWFESNLNKQQGLDQRGASTFLTAALGVLSEPDQTGGQLRGAIHTGFEPSLLSDRLPGHAWLKDRIKWMKQIFPEFDDVPDQVQMDPGKRRSPFPAFHSGIRYAIGNRELVLDGVQVLVGHDFVVIHEFRISPPGAEGIAPARGLPRQPRFAPPPGQSASLFSADFMQLSGQGTIKPPPEWLEGEFAVGFCPGVQAPLKCAMRSRERRYSGCVIVEKDHADSEPYFRAKVHINTSAYLTFLCTAIVNDAKVQYERQVADRVIADLEYRLASRSTRVAELLEVGSSRNEASIADSKNLENAQLTDRKLLDHFDQLVDTCCRNSEQFEQVVSKLMGADNQWAASILRRLRNDIADLAAERQALRRHFDTSQAFVDRLGQVSIEAAKSVESIPRVEEALLQLRNQLRRQFRDCNQFCVDFATFRLFEPSPEALDELFEYELHTPVSSARDFRSFTIALHMVFDEGVRNEQLRCWKRGEQLTDPLTGVAAVLHAQQFRQLTILRNQFAAHDALRGDAAKKRKKLLQVFKRLVGVGTVAGFKATDWLSLQKAVLEMLSAVLEELLQVFQKYQDTMRTRND